ncbi:MAG TPA: glutamate-1-semialdehyde 2,1-aminomutase [Actinomycetota bacterium]|nr:glutamate-1-semialdehyde 2,1-aminomutase [Actinomycetota bacterium]
MVELDRSRSEEMYARALRLIPGGVDSPVRAFGAVGSTPFFVAGAAGPSIFDIDGNAYVDWVQSWGASLLGHADDGVVAAVTDAARRGTSFGTPSPLEVELAELVTTMVPNAERVRFVSSGTEAAMTAIRLARGVTGRSKILKFAGCYHGHTDALLVEAGSGVATLGIPGSPGVTSGTVGDTVVVPYNDIGAAEAAAREIGDDLAAILVEPVAANMGLVLPREGFLEGLRALATELGSLLVFDEVITGFRIGNAGAQGRFGIDADLVLLGKVIGGGMPVGAIAGRADLMEHLAPTGPVYQAGTLSGNPVTMGAGIAVLSRLRDDPSIHDRIQDTGRALVRGLVDAADIAEVPMVASAIGGLAGFFFSDDDVENYEGAAATSPETYGKLFRGLLERGIYFPPSRFEALFISAAHEDGHVDQTVKAAHDVLTS